MSRFHLTFYSTTLMQRTDVNVFMPESLPPDKIMSDLPLVYLLHGLSGSRDDWMLNTSLARYVERYKLIVICPEGARGFYLDLPQGPAWYSYITKELPTKLAEWMKIGEKRGQRFIAGNSMGGYGAARILALNPESYRGMAAFSAPLAIEMLAILHEQEPTLYAEMNKMIGQKPETLIDTDMDPKQWLVQYQAWQNKYPEAELDLNFYCGVHDDFLPLNQYFVEAAKQSGLEFNYQEGDGGHEFHYWDRCINDWFKHISNLNPLR